MPNPAFRPSSDAEWENLLEQLRQQPQAYPRPFFYARVQARLATSSRVGSTWLPGWVLRPVCALIVSVLVVAVSGDGAALRAPTTAGYQQPSYRPASPRP